MAVYPGKTTGTVGRPKAFTSRRAVRLERSRCKARSRNVTVLPVTLVTASRSNFLLRFSSGHSPDTPDSQRRLQPSHKLLARAKVSVCTTVGLGPERRRVRSSRAPMPSAVPRARGASPAAPAPSDCAAGHALAELLRWARTRASQHSGRTPAIDIARLIARYPPTCFPTQISS
jgi:hypothetical protein